MSHDLPPGEVVEIDNKVIEQLTNVADQMTKLVGKMAEKHDSHSESFINFKHELQQVRDSLRKITKILMEGNGEKPLISRVDVLETLVKELSSDLKFLENEAAAKEKAALEGENIRNKGRYALWVAVLSGLSGLATAILK